MKPARNKLPFKRATDAEKEERIVQTMKLVIMGYSTADVKQWFREEHGISWGHALRYLRIARERLAAETGLSDDFTLNDMKVQHYAMAMKVAHADSGEDAKDRLAALKHAGSIYGVQAPQKIAPTSPDGQTPYIQASLEALRTMTVDELRLMSEVGRRRDAILARGSH
jgi:hypothetical protein